MKTNSKAIKENFKSSTMPRLKELFGYKSQKEINECPYLTYALLYLYNPLCVQDLLFEYLYHCRRTGKKADHITGRIIKCEDNEQFAQAVNNLYKEGAPSCKL